MSAELDKARGLVAAGKDKKALSALWVVQSWASTNESEARGLYELASTIRDRTDGRVHRDAKSLADIAERTLHTAAHPAEAKVATLSDCRVLECEGFNISTDAILELRFTTKGAVACSSDHDRSELARLDRSEINAIEFEEVPEPSTAKRKAGKAALGSSLGVLLGSGDAGWSAAGKLLERHTVKLTLLTARGRIVVLHRSPAKPEELESRLAPVLRTGTP